MKISGLFEGLQMLALLVILWMLAGAVDSVSPGQPSIQGQAVALAVGGVNRLIVNIEGGINGLIAATYPYWRITAVLTLVTGVAWAWVKTSPVADDLVASDRWTERRVRGVAKRL